MITVGSHVECAHDAVWQSERRSSDERKARKLGHNHFMGNAAAYMHLDEAYVVEEITATGGLKLRGFAPPVSVNDVRRSTKPVFR